MNFSFIEKLVFIFVKLDQQIPNSLSNQVRKCPVREVELNFCSDSLLLGEVRKYTQSSFSLENLSSFDGIIVFFNIEFITSIDFDCKESLNPIKVFSKGNKSVIVLVDSGKDQKKD